jgi:hypothetical protein
MEKLLPTETLEKHIQQAGVTTGPRKLHLFKLALALRGTPELYSQENADDPTVYVKLFDPCGAWTWFIFEWDSNLVAFGMTIGNEKELGYIDLAELAEVPGALGIGMEVDVWFKPQRLTQAIKDPPLGE